MATNVQLAKAHQKRNVNKFERKQWRLLLALTVRVRNSHAN